MIKHIIRLSGLVLLVGACGQPPSSSMDNLRDISSKSNESSMKGAAAAPIQTTETAHAPPSDMDSGRLLLIARTDLAERLEIAADEIEVRTIESVNWPDAGLGCPQPKKAYASVVTPGFRIQLAAHNQVYHYHTNRTDIVVFCPSEGFR